MEIDKANESFLNEGTVFIETFQSISLDINDLSVQETSDEQNVNTVSSRIALRMDDVAFHLPEAEFERLIKKIGAILGTSNAPCKISFFFECIEAISIYFQEIEGNKSEYQKCISDNLTSYQKQQSRKLQKLSKFLIPPTLWRPGKTCPSSDPQALI